MSNTYPKEGFNPAYANRLYNLLPAIYRARDVEEGEPLRALMNIMQRALERVQLNIGQLYDDCFIETCQEWVVPYIGQLVDRILTDDTHILPNQRAWVGNTIRFRGSKGIATALQPMIWSAADWYARVLQLFQRMVFAQNLHAIHDTWGRSVDIGDQLTLAQLNTPYNPIPLCAGFGARQYFGGPLNLDQLRVFIWRLANYPLNLVEPKPFTNRIYVNPLARYHFSPLGYDTPLFNHPRGSVPSGAPAPPSKLPAAIEPELFAADLRVYREIFAPIPPKDWPENSTYYGPKRALAVYLDSALISPMFVLPADLADWNLGPARVLVAVTAQDLPDSLDFDTDKPSVLVKIADAGPCLATLQAPPDDAEQAAAYLQAAIRDARTLDPALVMTHVLDIRRHLFLIHGLGGSGFSLSPSPESPFTLRQLKLTPQDLEPGLLSGDLAGFQGIEGPAEMTLSLDGDAPLLMQMDGVSKELQRAAEQLTAAVRTASWADVLAFTQASVLAGGDRLFVFSGDFCELPTFGPAPHDADTVFQLALDPDTATRLHGLLSEPIETPVAWPEPQNPLIISLGTTCASAMDIARAKDTLPKIAAYIQQRLRATKPGEATYDRAVVHVIGQRLFIQPGVFGDAAEVHPNRSSRLLGLAKAKGLAGIVSGPLEPEITLINPKPAMQLTMGSYGPTLVTLADTGGSLTLTRIAAALQHAIRHAATTLDPAFTRAEFYAVNDCYMSFKPGTKVSGMVFGPSQKDRTTVYELKLDPGKDYRALLLLSGSLREFPKPKAFPPKPYVSVTMGASEPFDAPLAGIPTNLSDAAGLLQTGIRKNSLDPAFRLARVYVDRSTSRLAVRSGTLMDPVTIHPSRKDPTTAEVLKLTLPQSTLYPALFSGDQADYGKPDYPPKPEVGVSIGIQGPVRVDLQGLTGTLTLRRAAALLQRSIRRAAPADPLFNTVRVALMEQSLKSGKKKKKHLVTLAPEMPAFSSTPGDPETAARLKLDGGSRTGWCSGNLDPFPKLFSKQTSLVANTVTGEYLATFNRNPTDLSSAARLLQKALRTAATTNPSFRNAGVLTLEDKLFTLPGLRGQEVVYSAAPRDPKTVETLRLNQLQPCYGVLSGRLFPFPDLTSRSNQNRGRYLSLFLWDGLEDLNPTTVPLVLAAVPENLPQAAVLLQTAIRNAYSPNDPDGCEPSSGTTQNVLENTNVLVYDQALLVLPGKFDSESPIYGPVAFGPADPGSADENWAAVAGLLLPNMVAVDVTLGRMAFWSNLESGNVRASYNYGFSADMGGGPYYRQDSEAVDESRVTTYNIGGYGQYETFASAFESWRNRKGAARFRFTDNGTYVVAEVNLSLFQNAWLIFEAAEEMRPVLILENTAVITAPESGSAAVTFQGLVIKGDVTVDGMAELALHFSDCTLIPPDPAQEGPTRPPANGGCGAGYHQPSRPNWRDFPPDLEINPAVIRVDERAEKTSLVFKRCILGRLVLPTYGRPLECYDSIVNAFAATDPSGLAVTGPGDGYGPECRLENTTLFGRSEFLGINYVSNVIFTGTVHTRNTQSGCVRYSYVPTGSVTPLRYRCQPDLARRETLRHLTGRGLSEDEFEDRLLLEVERVRPIFTSLVYPDPGFAQLAGSTSPAITAGGSNGSEMGVFSQLHQPVRSALTRQLYDENLPIGTQACGYQVT